MATPTVDLRPQRFDMKFQRGDTVGYPLGIKEGDPPELADLTGRTFAAQLRRSPNSSSAVDVEVDLAEAADGVVILRLEPSVTQTLVGEYKWDLQQTQGGTVRTILAGRWIFDADTTHD